MSKWKVGQKVRLLPYEKCMKISHGPGWVMGLDENDYDGDVMGNYVGKPMQISDASTEEDSWVTLKDSMWQYHEDWFIPAVVEMEYI